MTETNEYTIEFIKEGQPIDLHDLEEYIEKIGGCIKRTSSTRKYNM